jgi:hypothetical protein
MIQVFDPHRTMYRNAKLRAFADESKTTRIKFFDMTDVEDEERYDEIGLEVNTDQNGYLMRSGGQQKVSCLAVEKDAIIEVSLDGGTSWPIQWVLHAGDPGARMTIKDLFFFNGEGNEQSGNLSDTTIHLPDYLLRSEASLGNIWAEEETIVTGAYIGQWTNVSITDWTHIITFKDVTQHPSGGYVLEPSLRTGQIALVRNDSTITLNLASEDLGSVKTLAPGCLGIFFRSNDECIFEPLGQNAGDAKIQTITALAAEQGFDAESDIVCINGSFLPDNPPNNIVVNSSISDKLTILNNTGSAIYVIWDTARAYIGAGTLQVIYRPQTNLDFNGNIINPMVKSVSVAAGAQSSYAQTVDISGEDLDGRIVDVTISNMKADTVVINLVANVHTGCQCLVHLHGDVVLTNQAWIKINGNQTSKQTFNGTAFYCDALIIGANTRAFVV